MDEYQDMNEVINIFDTMDKYVNEYEMINYAQKKISVLVGHYDSAVKNQRVTTELVATLYYQTQTTIKEIESFTSIEYDYNNYIDQQDIEVDYYFVGVLDQQARVGILQKIAKAATDAWLKLTTFYQSKVMKVVGSMKGLEKISKDLKFKIEGNKDKFKNTEFDTSQLDRFEKEFGAMFSVLKTMPSSATDLLSDYVSITQVKPDDFGGFVSATLNDVKSTGKMKDPKLKLAVVNESLNNAFISLVSAGKVKFTGNSEDFMRAAKNKEIDLNLAYITGEDVTCVYIRKDFSALSNNKDAPAGFMSGKMTMLFGKHFQKLTTGKYEEAIKLITLAETLSKNYGPRIDKEFGSVKTAGANYKTTMDSLPDRELTEEENIGYKTAKVLYSMSPTIAYLRSKQAYHVIKNIIMYLTITNDFLDGKGKSPDEKENKDKKEEKQ